MDLLRPGLSCLDLSVLEAEQDWTPFRSCFVLIHKRLAYWERFRGSLLCCFFLVVVWEEETVVCVRVFEGVKQADSANQDLPM